MGINNFTPFVSSKVRENSQQVKDDAFRGADRVVEGLQRETEKGHDHSRSCDGLARPLPHGSYDVSLCPSLLWSFLQQFWCSSAQPGLGTSTEGTHIPAPQKLPAQTSKFQEVVRGLRDNCSLFLSTPCTVIRNTHVIMFKPKRGLLRWPGRGRTGICSPKPHIAGIGRPHFSTENCPLPTQETLVGLSWSGGSLPTPDHRVCTQFSPHFLEKDT